MKPEKQPQPQPQPSPIAMASPAPTEDYPVRVVLMSWDHILTFFVHHRACAALVLWLAVFLFDAIDTHMPAEWLVFTLFSFSVFVHAFAMSVFLFAALTVAMTMLNVAVFYLLPFKAASTCSTIVVCMLLVRAVHGLDSKGWAITALMALSRLNSPWCEALPNYLQAPIAAYCTSFAILWLAYHNARRIENLVDPISHWLGVVPPPRSPRIHLVAIHDRSVDVNWQLLPSPDAEDPDSTVPAARIVHYEIEVNGHIVGKCPSTVVQSPIGGLLPACMYQLRIWAVSASRGRTHSLPVFFTTLASDESLAQNGLVPIGDGSAATVDKSTTLPVDANKLRVEIEVSQRTIQELESDIAAIKANSEVERARLQEEISALRAQRKDEESSQAAQRETIRHLEAEKRHLESERVRLDRDIANALARRQRAQESLREQEKQADQHLRSAKSVEADMKKERRDHHHQQAGLQKNIVALKAEVDKAKQSLASLSSQQIELANSLRSKREAVAVQEKRNADLDLKVKEALQKKRQMKEKQAEAAKSAARMQAEIDALTPQLEQAIRERRRLETSANKPVSATFPPPGFFTPSYSASSAMPKPSVCGISSSATSGGNGGNLGAVEMTQPSALSYPASSIPAPALQRANPGGPGQNLNNGIRLARSSSFASSPLSAPPAVYASNTFKPASQRDVPSRDQINDALESSPCLVHIGFPRGTTSTRHSADFNGIFGHLDRDGSRVEPASVGLLLPLCANSHDIASQSAAIDSISLHYGGHGSGGSTRSMASTSMAAAAIPTGSINPASGGFAPRMSSMAFWGQPIVSPSSLSSTTAEASALSILKDTDLAYPTPERPSRMVARQYGEPSSFHQDFRTPPPALPPGLSSHQSLGRMFSNSMEVLVDPQHQHGSVASTLRDAPHTRFGSLDLRAGPTGNGCGGGWPEFDFPGGGRESGRSSTVNDRHTSPSADMTISDMGSFSLLRSATPVEPQPLRLSGDMLPVHRPHVDPIGAPIRRRPAGSGSPSPNDVQAPSSHQLSQPPSLPPVLPPAPIQFPSGFHMRREMSHPSSFGHSLYQKRSLWDHQEASAESSSPAQDQAAPEATS
ncbi:hypothetical protein IWW37_002858 [Coemansia sp. RSA 2050]|nr:hypothetical protein IWW37_002858 [Coemansia sp. RSA 2050]